MPDPSHDSLVRAIHNSRRRLVIAVTGGGSEAISSLLRVPGASQCLLSAVVPYSTAALAEWLGSAPEQACSATTARAMAMAAFIAAQRLAPHDDHAPLVGAACTASLATERAKRGAHRIHVATQTSLETASYTLHLEKGRRDRATEEALAALLLLDGIAAASGVGDEPTADSLRIVAPSERIETDRETASPERAGLLIGNPAKLVVRPDSGSDVVGDNQEPTQWVIFPGAFNPPHRGHLRMAALAEQRVGAPAMWEMSIINVDKPPLDFVEIRQRVAAIRSHDGQRSIVLTRAPTFRDKAELFPGSVFVVGADTIARIADPKYYDHNLQRRDEAINSIGARGCRFLVFGRQQAGRFQLLGDLDLPEALVKLCDEIPASEFREDVTSTQLRASNG